MRRAISVQAVFEVVGEFHESGGASVGLVRGSCASMSGWFLVLGNARGRRG
jgi:hypothetical protein